MRKTRSEKGITLVALIITIVVLLILAVVAINSITNEGILTHAQNATKTYKLSQAQEIASVGVLEAFLQSHVSEGEVNLLEVALANLRTAGYEVATETTAGASVTGVTFVDGQGVELTNLKLQKGESTTVKVRADVTNGAIKNYVKIDEMYHEVVYNETTRVITISENGVESITPGTLDTNVTLTSSLSTVTLSETKVASGASVTVTAATNATPDSGKITGTCGSAKGETAVTIEATTAISLAKDTETVEVGKTVEVAITATNAGTITATSSNANKVTASVSGTKLIIKGVAETAENETVTITVTENKRNQTDTIAVTVTAPTITVGTLINYNVPYTDMYQKESDGTTPKTFDANTGWKYFGVDATTGRHMIISSGTPLKLYYHYNDNTTNNWWGTTTEAEGAYGSGNTGSAYRAAYGLTNKFTSITFTQGTTSSTNEGYFTKIGNKTSGTLFQNGVNEFIASNASGAIVRTATYAEMNAISSSDSLRNVGNAYWLASATNSNLLYRVYSNGSISSGNYNTYGVRPVVVLPSNFQLTAVGQ